MSGASGWCKELKIPNQRLRSFRERKLLVITVQLMTNTTPCTPAYDLAWEVYGMSSSERNH